jgi:hypothetical protein
VQLEQLAEGLLIILAQTVEQSRGFLGNAHPRTSSCW